MTSSITYHSKYLAASRNILCFEVYKYWYRTCFPNKFVKLAVSSSINVSSQSGIVSNIELSKPHKIYVCYRIMSIRVKNFGSSGCGLVCFPGV